MEVLKFRQDLSIELNDKELKILGFFNGKISNLSINQRKMIQALITGIYIKNKEERIFLKRQVDENKLLNLLNQKGLLISHKINSSRNEEWFAHFRNILIQNHDQDEDYKQKAILLIGIGGTGSIIADHLARLGHKNFIFLDAAILDKNDLNRQLPYSKSMLGRKKVDALATYLEEEYEIKNILKLDLFLDSPIKNIILKLEPDFIINCADEPMESINETVLELADHYDKPLLFGSVGINDYVLGPLLVSKEDRSSYYNFLQTQKKQVKQAIIQTIKASNCLTNTRASIDLAMECFLYLSRTEKIITYNQSWLFNPFKREKSLLFKVS